MPTGSPQYNNSSLAIKVVGRTVQYSKANMNYKVNSFSSTLLRHPHGYFSDPAALLGIKVTEYGVLEALNREDRGKQRSCTIFNGPR